MTILVRWGKARFNIHQPGGETRSIIVKGRDRWMLENLIAAGPNGCTPIEQPGPRFSAYVYTLRHEFGLVIETVTEPHGGDFAGHHGRYVLIDRVTFDGEVQ